MRLSSEKGCQVREIITHVTCLSNFDIKLCLAAVFSLYLTPQKDGHAELTLGGIDHSKYHGQLTYSPLPVGSTPLPARYWQLISPQIFVNGKTNSTLKQSRTVMFDSGTSNILFDTETTEVIVFG